MTDFNEALSKGRAFIEQEIFKSLSGSGQMGIAVNFLNLKQSLNSFSFFLKIHLIQSPRQIFLKRGGKMVHVSKMEPVNFGVDLTKKKCLCFVLHFRNPTGQIL